MIRSYWRAGSGAVLVQSCEESRTLRTILDECHDADVGVISCALPGMRDARSGEAHKKVSTLSEAYAWAASEPGRVLVVHDWHTIINNAGAWRQLLEFLPRLKAPRGTSEGMPSCVAFVSPAWSLRDENPLRGMLPEVQVALPDREEMRSLLAQRLPVDLPSNGEGEAILDALCGLTADAAEQACGECLQRNNLVYDVDTIRSASHANLRRAGLEVWPTVDETGAPLEIGGLSGLTSAIEEDILPWYRDRQLAVNRILCAGLPGVGKSYWGRILARRLRCDCLRADLISCKGGTVGHTESAVSRLLAAIEARTRHAPAVIVLDEIDCLTVRDSGDPTAAPVHSMLLTWLQESKSRCQAIVIATLNDLARLDAPMSSRFGLQFFFDLPTSAERGAVARIHFARLGCSNVDSAAESLAVSSEGCASREIVALCESIARKTQRAPDTDTVVRLAKAFSPASLTQAAQLKTMREAAGSLTRANSPSAAATGGKRRIG
jgi:hypothetical protein